MSQLKDPKDADAYVLNWFEENDPELKSLEEHICENARVGLFATVLRQCFSAIRRQEYAITVPCLIAALEHIVIDLNPPEIVSRDVRKTLRRGGTIAKRTEQDVFAAAVWLSLHTFINDLYAQVPASEDVITLTLSRHGIQHGRKEPPNTKIEAIRLLNTVRTALALHDESPIWIVPSSSSAKQEQEN